MGSFFLTTVSSSLDEDTGLEADLLIFFFLVFFIVVLPFDHPSLVWIISSALQHIFQINESFFVNFELLFEVIESCFNP